MKPPIKKLLNGGLDCDSAEFVVPPNAFIAGKNLRFKSVVGGDGYIQNILKNAEKSHSLPTGTNITIGFAADAENGHIVKFNYNSNDDHGIYLFDIITETWYTVLLDSDVTGGLNFNKYQLINGAYIINHILYWNDNNNEPRKLHLGAFISGYVVSPQQSPIESDYTISYPIDDFEITLIRKPCAFPPFIQKLYDSGFNNNFIANESFQFAIRYVHFEGEESVLSDWSKSSFLNSTADNFNYVHVVLNNLESVPQTVRLVQLVVKIGSTKKGFVIKQWDRLISTENTEIDANNLTYDFYGDVLGEIIDDPSMVRPFHSVPLQSGTQERGKNRTLLADNLEGYDTPTTSSLALSLPSSVSLGFTSITKPIWTIKHRRLTGIQGCVVYAYTAYYVLLTEVSPAGWYAITSTEQTVTGSFVYPTLPAQPTTVAFTGLTYRGASYLDAVAATRPGTCQFLTEQVLTYVGTISVTGISTNIYNVFLPQSKHKAAVTFYDRYLRKCGVVYSDDLIEIPPRNYAFSAGYGSIDWSLGYSNALAEIPDWAYYYTVDLTRNLRTPYFVASFDDAAKYATRNATTGLLEFTSTTFGINVVAIAINSKALLQANLGWTVAEGDQCILIDNSNNRYELPVIGQEGDYLLLKARDIGDTSAKTFVYELYVPYKQSEQEPFFTRGEMYRITDPTTSLRNYETLYGSFRADTFVLSRSYNSVTYFAETMSPNDVYFERWDTDAGRPNLVTKLGQVRKPTGLSFSNVYIQGTQTNGLSAFEALNKEVLPEDIGTIRKLVLTTKVQKDGSVLLAIGEQETASIYLGETQVFDSEGNSFLAKSDKFIGQVNVLKGGFGTSNHESVVEYKGRVGWYSLNRASFVIYYENGIHPISDNGLRSVAYAFTKKFETLSNADIEALGSRPFVFGGVDPSIDEMFWSIPSTEETPPDGYLEDYVSPDTPIIYPYTVYDGVAKVLVYDLVADKWRAPDEYQTEGFVDIRNLLYSAKSGSLWKHNVDDATPNTYSSWYGETVKPAIAFIINEEPNIIKEYLTLSVEGNQTPNFVHFRTEMPNIQSSDVLFDTDVAWVNREGVRYPKNGIMRDRLSPNTTGSFNEKLFKGDKMRGNWLKIWVEFNTAGLLQIRFFNVGYIKSIGHNT